MSLLSDAYRAVFLKLRGKGLGLGLFNRFHALVWGRLQPDRVVVHGCTILLPKSDHTQADALRMEGVVEKAETEEFLRLVKPGMTVVDLGANIGYYTVLAAKLVGEAGRVHAFEPDADNLALLRANVELNAAKNVTVHPCAAGEAKGTLTFYLSRESPTRHSVVAPPDDPGAKDAPSRQVDVVAVDEALAGAEADVLKMDIEGGELAALKGMKRLLASARLKTVFIEVNRPYLTARGIDPEDVLRPLTAAGFKAARQLNADNLLLTR